MKPVNTSAVRLAGESEEQTYQEAVSELLSLDAARGDLERQREACDATCADAYQGPIDELTAFVARWERAYAIALESSSQVYNGDGWEANAGLLPRLAARHRQWLLRQSAAWRVLGETLRSAEGPTSVKRGVWGSIYQFVKALPPEAAGDWVGTIKKPCAADDARQQEWLPELAPAAVHVPRKRSKALLA